jgi:hypothetical protein
LSLFFNYNLVFDLQLKKITANLSEDRIALAVQCEVFIKPHFIPYQAQKGCSMKYFGYVCRRLFGCLDLSGIPGALGMNILLTTLFTNVIYVLCWQYRNEYRVGMSIDMKFNI